MYEIVVIGNPIFSNGRLSSPCVYAAATATKIGLEQIAIVSSVDDSLKNKFIEGIDALDIPEYFVIEAKHKHAVEIRNPTLNRNMTTLVSPERINIRDIPDEFLNTRAVLLSPSLQEVSAELVEWICNSTDALVFLDPQLRKLNSEGRLEVIRDFSVTEKTQSYLDVIKPNQLESELITGESDPFLAAELIVEWASEVCVITLGEKGSLIYDGNDFSFIPSYPSQVIDSSGVGSVYLAAFAAKLASEEPLIDCGVYATSVASLKVENDGLNFSMDKSKIRHRSDTIARAVESR
ncbi:MAG: carbohydrate kinase family protein [Candidatus Thorarchaeota archaeon]